MISKIVLLLSLSAALSSHLQYTPADLKEFFDTIYDDIINDKYGQAQIGIQANSASLAFIVNQYSLAILEEFIQASKPFRDFVQSAEEDAESKGQDISKCIDLADEELFNLNETYRKPIGDNLSFWYDKGNDAIYSASEDIASVGRETIDLKTVVYDCNDDDCANQLRETVTEFYQVALNTLNEIVVNSSIFVHSYIPSMLSLRLDQVAYQQDAAEIIDDVQNCINNL